MSMGAAVDDGVPAAPAHGRSIAVLGLGYIGLAIAVAFGRSGAPVVGFDVSGARLAELRAGDDRNAEIGREDLLRSHVRYTADPADLSVADFFIVVAPTPIDAGQNPDLGPLRAASEMVARNLKRNDIVVYASTVFPGITEEECVPLLERMSGLVAGRDFQVGYSYERINPGDFAHRFETIKKVIACPDPDALKLIADVYATVVPAGIYTLSSIRTAEAAKLVENIQRDINAAFMNEISELLGGVGIDTQEMLAAAATKWNFLPFEPGLVGGNSVGIAAHYLLALAKNVGFDARLTRLAREINDRVPARVAQECLRRLPREGTRRVTVLGLAFKENVPDVRNSKAIDIVKRLLAAGVSVQVHDPFAKHEDALRFGGISLSDEADLAPADGIVLAAAHKHYVESGWPLVTRLLREGEGFVLDVKAVLDPRTKPASIELWRL